MAGGERIPPAFVVVFQASQYWFTVPEVDDRNLTPVASPAAFAARPSRGYTVLTSLSDSVKTLRPVVVNATTGQQPSK